MRLHPAEKSRGVALITVMLVVALATIAAVAVSARLQLDIRKSENLFRADQAWLHILGLENWAQGVLAEDRKQSAVDHLQEDWSKPLEEVPVDNGVVSGQLVDLQGLFNLNNLSSVPPPSANGKKPSLIHLERFRRLLEALEQDPELADGLLDWMDVDNNPRFPKGAEDDVYQGRAPAYRTANRQLTHPSELLLVQGFNPDVYNALVPYVAALPIPDGGVAGATVGDVGAPIVVAGTPINVNTAPVPVLMSLAKGITEEIAEKLVEARDQNPWQDLNAFLIHPALAGIPFDEGNNENKDNNKDDNKGDNKDLTDKISLSVKSDFFQLRGTVQVGRMQLAVSSLLDRTVPPPPKAQAKVKIIQRIREGLFSG